MKQIIKIVISGESGYCPQDEAYKDRVTLEPTGISYLYTPLVETNLNPARKWSYKTTSPIFHELYAEVVRNVAEIMNASIELFCTDVGSITFKVTYSDKTTTSRSFWCTGDEFKNCFAIIKRMVPECEYVPAVLLTEDDYPEDEEGK